MELQNMFGLIRGKLIGEALKIAGVAAEFASKFCTREYAFQQWNTIICDNT